MARTLLDVLQEKQVLTAAEAADINAAATAGDTPLEDMLYKRGIEERDVAQAKSELTGFPMSTANPEDVPGAVLKLVPEQSARHYEMAPIGQNEGYLDVGMLHPENLASQEALKFIASQVDLPIRTFVITPTDFEKTMTLYRTLSGEVGKALGEFQKEFQTLNKELELDEESIGGHIIEEAPVTKMLAVIFRHAVEGRASDIHIEPTRERLRIRFRVDGVLHTSLTLPANIHQAVATRIKVLTNMKIDETRVPQDGRFHAEIAGRPIDFRVSTLPAAHGEKVVIRILDPTANLLTLETLGVSGRNLQLVNTSIAKPYGMILLTGPTGSGKSTTLYTILSLLNKEQVNIVSLEDPIEYFIEGVNQSLIRPEIGYSFATGIRHVLRQDPDIIMVGEIRDKETAALAVHAALTGHLVFSTLHTNNAIGVVPRLIDMGVDPFLISSTLILAVAQRLVRRLCPDSRKEIPLAGALQRRIMEEIKTMPETLQSLLPKRMPASIFGADATASCPKGTRGRIGIFETLSMTPQLEHIILERPSEQAIAEEARRQEMVTMRQDGILKVLDGMIGLEELMETV